MPGATAHGDLYSLPHEGAWVAPGASTNPPAKTAKLSLSTPYVSLSSADISSFSS